MNNNLSLFDFEPVYFEEIISKFIDLNKSKVIDYEMFKKSITNKGNLHNHTLENLFLYFDLRQNLDKNKIVFFDKAILFINKKKCKMFVYDEDEIMNKIDFSPFLESDEFFSKFLLYSSTELTDKINLTQSKFKECIYDLDDIFNPETYKEKYKGCNSKKISKKIYNRIKYPFIYLNTNKFRHEEISSNNINDVEEIHSKWVKHKLSDEKTFQIMFSAKRYIFCVKESMIDAELKNSTFYKKIFYWENKPVAVRLCLLKGDKSYDISFFSTFFECPSNLILYINAFCLNELKEKHGIKRHNCGMELNKLLKNSKEHFPSTQLTGYKYNFKKKKV